MKVYIQNLTRYKDLFFELVKHDIKLKYRNSILGILWSMLNPLLMMIVMSIVFMELFKTNTPNYPLYVLTGRILYQFFAESTSFAMDSIYANSQLVRKVYVPKYFFPLARVSSSFVTTLISLVTVVTLIAVTDVPFRWLNLMFIVPMIYLLVISAGVGLILSSITVFFKDVKHFYSIVLLVVMYMTPIFYPASIIPRKYQFILNLNPLYLVLDMFRDIVITGSIPALSEHLILIGYMIVVGLVGLGLFYKTQDKFIYHL
ncbi:ABC-2 type transport system permease protein/lipopolysaccharide transport system permease protein [Paenibacillus taihuensis]|uniref:Transport permease protein n=1 Tax=Paenibacillus taihuensis TaxID=1156355 RepID=A0A3D9SB51_9BACL|nr:ABC transporter permease [Paenibacillus taihuensis]REE90514.1 ABC-2 type transport system permease protein/lipopolysaccharide transport system permease protein [Paenibacillus taihuensis]